MAIYTRKRSKYKKNVEKNSIQAMRFAEAIRTSYNPQQIKLLADKKNQALLSAKKENALYTNNPKLWDNLDILDEAIKILAKDIPAQKEMPAKNPISQAIASLVNKNRDTEKEKKKALNNTTVPITRGKNPFEGKQVMPANVDTLTEKTAAMLSNTATSPFKKEMDFSLNNPAQVPVFLL
ncbi:MAG: hypothetical protein PHX18_08985 [Candidatus Gastranaerophilales bacterium]|nr:hypothetical protein [Candidatus Gastranaerophilales bacterium]